MQNIRIPLFIYLFIYFVYLFVCLFIYFIFYFVFFCEVKILKGFFVNPIEQDIITQKWKLIPA